MEENKVIKDKKDKVLVVIIVCLAVILITLFIFFMIERNENKAHIAAIHQEKELLEQELTELSHNYDDLKTNNDTLNAKLLGEQEKIAQLLDQMKKFRDNSYAEINRYKREIGTLKNVLRSYVVQIDSLNQLNQKLAQENTEVRKQMNWVRERNQKLENQQKDMKEVIARASALRAENFVVYPVNKKDKETNWKKCFNLKAEFAISKNITTERGQRTIYLRLKRPDDKVIAFSDKSFFKYENVSLTYSAKREITYEGERLEMAIYWPNDGSLIKGKYTAELFCDNEIIGTTEFFLK
jgi:FtsZ-binding cell division protein ZapB